MKSKVLISICSAWVVFLFCGLAESKEVAALKWATGSIGGVWFVEGAGMARIISKMYPEIKIDILPGGGVVSPVQVGKNQADLGMVLTSDLGKVLKGEYPFKEAFPNIRVILGGFAQSLIHFAIAPDTNIQTIEQIIKDKYPLKLNIQTPRQIGSSIAIEIFKYYNVSLENIKNWGGMIYPAEAGQAVQLWQDRKIDAMIQFQAVNAAIFTEAKVSRAMRFLPMSEPLIKHMEKATNCNRTVIPGGSYDGMVKQDVPTIQAGMIIIANTNTQEEVVYKITRALSENMKQVRAVHPAMFDFDPKTTLNYPPLHPGAERYFKEIGLKK